MKRFLLATALAGGVVLSTVPASAGPVGVGGTCGQHKVQVLCQTQPCQPDYPCHIEFCLVWTNGDCGLT